MNKIKSRYTASEWREMGLSPLYAKRPDEFAAEREIRREKARRVVEAAVGVPLIVICAAAFVVCCAVM